MSTIASAYVQIIPSAEGITGSLTKALGGEADTAGRSAGASMASKIKGMLVKAGIGAAVGKVLKSSIDAGGALQQSFGGLETIYGDAADAAKNYAYEAAKAGISANDYAEQAVSFGASLKQAFGGDTTKAVEAANTAIMDMTDNAAKMGTPIESIQNAYQGFAKSNYTMLDNLKLGYGGTKEEMQRLLADAQKLSGVEYDISNLGDVYDAIHVIQEDLGLTGVAAQEASETFSGSFGAMKASAQNLLANLSLGKDIRKPLSELLGNTRTFLTGNFLPMIGNILKGVPTIIGQAFSGFTSAIPSMASAAASMIRGFGQSIGAALPSLIPAALNMVSTFWENVRGAAGQLVDAGIDMIKNIATGLITGIPAFIETVPVVMENMAGIINDNAPKLFQAGIELLGQLANGIINAIPTLVSNLPRIFDAMLAMWQAMNWVSLGTQAITFIGNGLKALFNALPTILKSIGTAALNLFRSINWIGVGRTVITLIRSGIQALFTALPTLLKSIGTSAMNLFRSINWASVGRAVINLIKSGIRALFTGIPTLLKTIGTSAMSGFKSINWASVGWAVVNGIKSGISSLAGSLIESVKSLGARALSGIKGILGIASPSKVFADEVGANMALGIKQGWEKNLPVDDMISDTKRMTSDLSSAASFSASGTVTAPTSGDKLDAILQLLGYYFPVLADRDVVLDSDKLVGALAPGINRKLGMITGW